MDNKQEGFIKISVDLYVKTTIGDHWKNNDVKFLELKQHNGRLGYVVDEKEKE